jgi:hypothetical protein
VQAQLGWAESPVQPRPKLVARYVFRHCLNCNFFIGSTKNDRDITDRKMLNFSVFFLKPTNKYVFYVFRHDRQELVF